MEEESKILEVMYYFYLKVLFRIQFKMIIKY